MELAALTDHQQWQYQQNSINVRVRAFVQNKFWHGCITAVM